MMMRRVVVAGTLVILLVGQMGCSSWSRKTKGAVIGAGAGAAVGGIIGKQAGNTAVGAILGAAVGGAAGAYIGNYMDNQAEEMERDLQNARIERVGEGIKITFDSGLLFDVDKSELKTRSRTELAELAVILNKYEDTNIVLEGHTDATGSADYNLGLSERRAKSVGNYLSVQGVNPTRFTVMGYGEDQPLASNETADGRALNRRVEVAIFANDKLKKVAQNQADG